MQTQTIVGGVLGLIGGGAIGVVAGGAIKKSIRGPKELPELLGIMGAIAGGVIVAALTTPAVPTTVTPGGPAFVPGA